MTGAADGKKQLHTAMERDAANGVDRIYASEGRVEMCKVAESTLSVYTMLTVEINFFKNQKIANTVALN